MENKNFEYDYHLTAHDVAKLLSYNEQYVRHLAREGKLPGIRRGRQWFFSEREIVTVLHNMTKDSRTFSTERNLNDEEGSAPTSDLF